MLSNPRSVEREGSQLLGGKGGTRSVQDRSRWADRCMGRWLLTGPISSRKPRRVEAPGRLEVLCLIDTVAHRMPDDRLIGPLAAVLGGHHSVRSR